MIEDPILMNPTPVKMIRRDGETGIVEVGDIRVTVNQKQWNFIWNEKFGEAFTKGEIVNQQLDAFLYSYLEHENVIESEFSRDRAWGDIFGRVEKHENSRSIHLKLVYREEPISCRIYISNGEWEQQVDNLVFKRVMDEMIEAIDEYLMTLM